MKKIMLVCNAGMSTSILMTKMEESIKAKGLQNEIEVFAKPEVEAKKVISSGNADVVLLGPQIIYSFEIFKKIAAEAGIPIELINAVDYGRMNGDKTLMDALSLMEEKK